MFGLHWVSVSTALPAVTWILPGDCSRSWRNTRAPTEMNFNFCYVVRLNYQTRRYDIRVWEEKGMFRVGLKDMMAQDASVWPVIIRAAALTCILFICTSCLVLPSFSPSGQSSCCPKLSSLLPLTLSPPPPWLVVRDEAVLSYLSVLSLLALCKYFRLWI